MDQQDPAGHEDPTRPSQPQPLHPQEGPRDRDRQHAPPPQAPPMPQAPAESPHQAAFAFAYPAGYGYTVDADTESAGLVRQEKPGWALLFAALGVLSVIPALFMPWVRAQFFIVYERNADGPLEDRDENAGLFSAVDTVRDVTEHAPRAPDPGTLSDLFFPWSAILLTILCCVAVVIAAVGLRQRRRTNTARSIALVLGAITVLLALAASMDLGITLGDDGGGAATSPSTSAAVKPGEPEVSWSEHNVEPHAGSASWVLGGLFLAIAAMLGPRVVHRLPDGSTSTQLGDVLAAYLMPGLPTPVQPMQAPLHSGRLGPFPGSGYPAALPGGLPHQLLRHTTQVSAVVLTGLAAALCLAGYGFLPWATETTFSDIGEAAREYGFDDKPVTEAYFAWLGWAILLATVVMVVLVGLGRRPSGVNPKALRPVLAIGSIGCGLLHLWMMIDLGAEGAEFDVGTYAVALGLTLAVIGTLLPLRTSARMMAGPYPGPPR